MPGDFVFFDKQTVLNATDKATRQALSKFGAFVRTRARSSIRSRKKISRPGQPPSSHSGHLKRLIYFGYDKPNKSVVVGPLPFHKGVANIIEYGGVSNGALYRPRPFMRPAFAVELKNAPKLFKDTIK